MDDTMEEEEMLARPSPLATPNTICTRCPVLEKNIVFYQKEISLLRRSKSAEANTLHIVQLQGFCI